VGWNSADVIGTRYMLDGPGIESQWGRDLPHPSRPTLGPPKLLYTGYRVFPEANRPWCDVDYPPHPAPSYTSTLPLGVRGLLGETCLFNEIMWKNLQIRRDHK
jgi:hypothetical protein